MGSPQVHKRDKTESFAGNQMEFEFPSREQSPIRYPGSMSDMSSGIYDNNTFDHLTNISVSSSVGNTLSTAELFRPLEEEPSIHTKTNSFKSKYTASLLSVKIKNENFNKRNPSRSSRVVVTSLRPRTSISRSPTIRSLHKARTNAAFTTAPLSRASTSGSSLKRSNAIKHKEGWLTRLIRKLFRFKNNWRRIMTKRAFKQNSNMSRSNSIVRSKSFKVIPHKSNSMRLPPITKPKDDLAFFIQQEERLSDLESMSQTLLQKIETPQPAPVQRTVNAPQPVPVVSYPAPTVDTSYNDTTITTKSLDDENLQDIYKLWSHYLRQLVMNRIQLKLDIKEYRDTGDMKRESVLDSIISDYEDDDNSSISDSVSSYDGHSSMTSMSSYSSNDEEIMSESDVNSIQESIRQSILGSIRRSNARNVSFKNEDDDVSDYQSSYYPSRQNSMISRNLSTNIKRNNSMMVKRMLTIKSESSNMTYIEDFVNIKTQKAVNTTEISQYDRSNPYLTTQMTRSPSFVISKRTNII